MKVLGLCFSPRKQGNTEILLNEALSGAQHEGAEVELYGVLGKNIQPCDGCWTCLKTGICHIKDDMQELYKKLLEADGIIFGSPIYVYAMTSQAKIILDRTTALQHPPEIRLANKVGGIIVVCGSLGLVDVVKDFYFFMVTRQMLPAHFVAAYAGNKGEVKNLPKCIKASWQLGREMVLLANKKFEYPSEFWRGGIAFGTHTR